ncbi:maleylacetoacetate isomerase [Luteibacter sp. Sphag1AF]|uniref:maleylacetoacetate isomerase n=1 Tax=Luteibacter sp. Sphag1AF TaxID=2587031 RepID=UPI00160EFF30|nr:maleylacetoacetate isomerase [Luteibacter sp. Sphag1AF]MBB3225892.1 maleylacetoacetate isomerase [Luteibacter sp. Sphag1AF]
MTASSLVLYSYWRSSAAFRVRIALNLKGLPYQVHPVHLISDGGQQHSASYRELSPQEQIPTLVDGDFVVRQSMTIMEYLDERFPETPLLPRNDVRGRARVRELMQVVACDIHPLGNLRVLQHLEATYGAGQEQKADWSRHWIALGLNAFEALLARGDTGTFCHGDTPTLADACLIPQVYNANRWGVDLSGMPNICRVAAAAQALPAFADAAPEAQLDAV